MSPYRNTHCLLSPLFHSFLPYCLRASFSCVVQRYVELFRSTKGEMMAAMQQRMFPHGTAGAMGGYMGMGSVR